MSAGFVKIYGEILDSTVWLEELPTKVVWITMLAMADALGFVAASIPGLAKRAGVSLEQCEEAIRVLSSPDPHSRTKAHRGRRVKAVPGGWLILNAKTYRERRTETQIKEADRKRLWRNGQRTGTNGTRPACPVQSGVDREGTEVTEPTEKSITTTHAPSGADISKRRNGKSDYTPEFEELWENRPIRAGTDSKTAGLKAYNARIREGVLHSTLAEGVARYKAFCTATGKIGTEFTMASAAFLGPKQHFLNPYTLPTEGGLTIEQRSEVEQLVEVCLRFGVFHLTTKREIDQVCAQIAEEMTFTFAEIAAKVTKLNSAKCLRASDRAALTGYVAEELFGVKAVNRTNGSDRTHGSHRNVTAGAVSW